MYKFPGKIYIVLSGFQKNPRTWHRCRRRRGRERVVDVKVVPTVAVLFAVFVAAFALLHFLLPAIVVDLRVSGLQLLHRHLQHLDFGRLGLLQRDQ